jgi:hypothetical protein
VNTPHKNFFIKSSRSRIRVEGILPSERRAMLMDIFQFIQITSFALAFFMAGYSIGRKK